MVSFVVVSVFFFLWWVALGEPPRISIREMGAVIETLDREFLFLSLSLFLFLSLSISLPSGQHELR